MIFVVDHYDLSVLSMSVMGLKKNSLDRGVGGVSSIQFLFGFFQDDPGYCVLQSKVISCRCTYQAGLHSS